MIHRLNFLEEVAKFNIIGDTAVVTFPQGTTVTTTVERAREIYLHFRSKGYQKPHIADWSDYDLAAEEAEWQNSFE